jgi:hypothetical protein
MSNKDGVQLATAWIKLVASVDGIQETVTKEMGGAASAAEKAGSDTGKRFGGGFGSAAKSAIGVMAGAAVIGTASAWASSTMKDLQEVERLAAQTSSVLSSTGGVAGVTAEGVSALADSLEKTTATEAEATTEGINFLLTFKDIKNTAGEGNDVFDQTTRAMVDMARATGGDMQGAALQLGKALNDPIKGVGALSKVGVGFTDQQKEQIKTMQESGDIMGAQKIILGELNSQFGGSGAAYAETTAGKMKILENSFGNLSETVMSSLMPALTFFAEKGTLAFTWLAENPVIVSIILAAAAALAILAAAMWLASLTPLTLIIAAIIVGIALLAAAVVWIVNNWGGIAEWFGSLWASIGEFFRVGWEAVITGLTAAWEWVKGVTEAVWNGLLGFFGMIWDGIVWMFQNLTLAGIILSHWNEIVAFTTTLWNGIANFFGGLWANITNGVSNFVGGIGSFFASIPGTVMGVFVGAATWLYDIGRNIVEGLLNGLRSLGSSIGSFFLSLLPGWIVEPFKAALGIHSPSKVFFGFGQNIGQGVINGTDSMGSAISDKMANLVPIPSVPRITADNVGLLDPEEMGSGTGAHAVIEIKGTGLDENLLADLAVEKIRKKARR